MENDYQIWKSPIDKLQIYEPWKKTKKKKGCEALFAITQEGNEIFTLHGRASRTSMVSSHGHGHGQ